MTLTHAITIVSIGKMLNNKTDPRTIRDYATMIILGCEITSITCIL